MTHAHRRPVVVGVDGRHATAIDLAAAEAALRGAPLHLLHAASYRLYNLPERIPTATGGSVRPDRASYAEKALHGAADYVQAAYPELSITLLRAVERPADALLVASADAGLVVVGNRRPGRVGRFFSDAVANNVAAHASCPVLVAHHGHDNPYGDIVVGVDDSPASASAVEFAVEEAALRGTAVRVLHADKRAADAGMSVLDELGDDTVTESVEQRSMLDAMLAGPRSRFPDVKVTHHVVATAAGTALIEASRSASLLVVGSRGVSGMRGALVGSTSQAVVNEADCPVAVVRAR